jgi:hypothetical protein
MSAEKFWLLGVMIVAPAGAADFAKDVQPIFEKSCYSCHGPKQQMGGLRLDSKTLALAVIQPRPRSTIATSSQQRPDAGRGMGLPVPCR